MATLPATNISLFNVAALVSANSISVSACCTAAAINMWSRWKPVRSSAITMTDTLMKGTNFGLDVANSKLPDNLTASTTPSGYTYLKPRGGAAEPFRLGDFRNYNDSARPFLYVSDVVWNTAFVDTPTADRVTALPNFKFGAGSGQGQGDQAGMEIFPAELSGGSGLDFSNMYIGMFIFIGGTQYTIFSNRKLGEVSAGTVIIQFSSSPALCSIMNAAAQNTEWKFIPFLSASNNPAGTPKFNLPTGEYVTVKKTASFNWSVHTITCAITSSRRGQLGLGPTRFQEPSAIVTYNKPYSADTTEIISATYLCTFTNTSYAQSTLQRSMLQMAIGTGASPRVVSVGSMKRMDTGQIVDQILFQGNQSIQVELYANDIIAAATLRNFPNNNGQSSSNVSLGCNIYFNGNLLPSADTVVSRWNAYP